MLDSLLAFLLGVPARWDYALAFAVTFGETAFLLGIVLPGETALILGGVLAAQGVLRPELVFAAGAAGCIIGDFVGYLLGASLGPRLLDRDWLFGLVKRDALAEARAAFARNGGKAVLLGRFTALLRALTPAAAGAAQMPLVRFLTFDVVGGVAWAGGSVALGYLAGSAWQVAAARVGHATVLLAAAAVLTIAWMKYRRRLRDRSRFLIGLTAAATVTVLGFASFVGVAERWIDASGLTSLDQSAVRLAESLHSPWLAWPLSVTSALGGVLATCLVALGTLAWLLRRARVRRAVWFGAMVLSGALIVLALKEFFHAAEQTFGLATGRGWAFPSASTFLSIVVYGLCARTVVSELRPPRPVAWAVAVGAAVIVLASATGHVYQGARWTTDVLAGGLLGCGWVALGLGLFGLTDAVSDSDSEEASSSFPAPNHRSHSS